MTNVESGDQKGMAGRIKGVTPDYLDMVKVNITEGVGEGMTSEVAFPLGDWQWSTGKAYWQSLPDCLHYPIKTLENQVCFDRLWKIFCKIVTEVDEVVGGSPDAHEQ